MIIEQKTFYCRSILYGLAFSAAMFFSSSCGEKGKGPEEQPVARYASVYDDNANMPSGGVITSEFGDSPFGSDISKLVDNDLKTSFATNHSSFYVVFDGNKSAEIVSYSVISSDSAPECDPSSWTLSASNDNKKWVQIDKQSSQSFERNEKKTYTVEPGSTYKSYKLEVTANNGSTSTRIAEWMLSAEEVADIQIPITEIPELSLYIGKSDGWSYSDKTPMGIHYENCPEATAEDLAWLADPDTDIDIPVSAAGLEEGSVSWSNPIFRLYPAGKPRPADVNQHGIGDCCLCAAFASMAYLYPDFIMDIITSKGNGKYEVKMFDPKGNPIIVGLTESCLMNSDGGIVAMSGKDNVATWGTLLEKAIMKWNCIFKKSPSLGGIGTEIVPPLFTGNGGSVAFAPGKLTAQELKKVVDILLDHGVLVVGGFTTSNITITPGPFYTVNGHAYTFLRSPNEEALFMMRNPWGAAAGSPDGKEDGAMDILDDGIIPPLIDLRVVEPGAAFPYRIDPVPYVPPVFSRNSFWLTPEMMRQHGM